MKQPESYKCYIFAQKFREHKKTDRNIQQNNQLI